MSKQDTDLYIRKSLTCPLKYIQTIPWCSLQKSRGICQSASDHHLHPTAGSYPRKLQRSTCLKTTANKMCWRLPEMLTDIWLWDWNVPSIATEALHLYMLCVLRVFSHTVVLVLVQPLVAIICEEFILSKGCIHKAVHKRRSQVHPGRVHLGATASKPCHIQHKGDGAWVHLAQLNSKSQNTDRIKLPHFVFNDVNGFKEPNTGLLKWAKSDR